MTLAVPQSTGGSINGMIAASDANFDDTIIIAWRWL
jgi:hypothetical protein